MPQTYLYDQQMGELIASSYLARNPSKKAKAKTMANWPLRKRKKENEQVKGKKLELQFVRRDPISVAPFLHGHIGFFLYFIST
jgi:hypothetical protein